MHCQFSSKHTLEFFNNFFNSRYFQGNDDFLNAFVKGHFLQKKKIKFQQRFIDILSTLLLLLLTSFVGKLCLFHFLRCRLFHCKIIPGVSFTLLYISYIIETVAPSSLQLVHCAKLSPLTNFQRSPVIFPLLLARLLVPHKLLPKYHFILFQAHPPLKLPPKSEDQSSTLGLGPA